MAELGAGGGSGYPGVIDTDAALEVDGVNIARADVPNDLAEAIVKIETELGTDPAGVSVDLKTRLGNVLAAEFAQLETLGATNISAAQWGYLGGSTGIDHYVDRGDPVGWDKGVGDFTTDGTWRDLDLSAIVPAGVRTIHIHCVMNDDVATSEILFREKGNANEVNYLGGPCIVANIWRDIDGIVSCDANRVIQYKGSNVAFAAINLTIRGWWV